MDGLKCAPIFEIRDSQAAQSDVNQFGGLGAELKGRSADTPGPPFHVAQANLNLDVDPNSFNYLSSTTSGDSPQYQLPNRNRPSRPNQLGYTGRMHTLADSLSPGSDEGRSPNINNDHQSTRSSSYKDSSSHTSFTPPSMDDSNQQPQRQNSVQTPSSISSASSLPTPAARNLGADNSPFYNFTADINFSNFQSGFAQQPINMDTGVFPMQSSWEMSGIEITSGSGMTPMADQPWSQMLEGIEDWGGNLTTSQYDASLPGRRTS
jgi:hypothetical protein